MEIDAHLQSFFYLTFRVPSLGDLPPGSVHRDPTGDRRPTFRDPFKHISKSLVDEPNPGYPSEPPWREMPVARTFLSLPSGSLAKEQPFQFPLPEVAPGIIMLPAIGHNPVILCLRVGSVTRMYCCSCDQNFACNVEQTRLSPGNRKVMNGSLQ